MSAGWLSPWAIRDTALGKWIWKNQDGDTPAWEFPNRSGIVALTTTDDPYIKAVEHFNKVLAVAAAYVRSNQDASAVLPITFTIDAQPDVPRTLTYSFDSHAQITAFSLVFTGVDAKGKVITDTFTQVSGWTGTTAHAYATITSIKLNTRTGTGAGDTIDIGIGTSLGLANELNVAGDVFKIAKSAAAGNSADLAAAAYTAEAVNDTVDVSTGGAIVAGDSFTIWYKSRLLNI